MSDKYYYVIAAVLISKRDIATLLNRYTLNNTLNEDTSVCYKKVINIDSNMRSNNAENVSLQFNYYSLQLYTFAEVHNNDSTIIVQLS